VGANSASAPPTAAIDSKSVAVLPFSDLSPAMHFRQSVSGVMRLIQEQQPSVSPRWNNEHGGLFA